jgi:outer membrane biosynthesis protein TonB
VEIPLSFSLGPGYRIDVKARVVWVNAHGKLGGAAFGKLSKDSRSLIREWLAKPEVEHETENAVVASEADNDAQRPVRESALAGDATPASAIPVQAAASNGANEAAAERPSVASVEEAAARNGVVLPPVNVQQPAEPSPATSFPAHEIAPAPIPANRVPVPEPIVAAAAPPDAPRVAAGVAAPVGIAPDAPKPPHPAAPVRSQAPTAPPPAASEMKREPAAGASFSLVPSISAWNRGNASPASSAFPQPKAAGPLFPPRNAENLFARPSSPVQSESGRRRGSALMIIAVVIAAGALVAFYARAHRQQIGDALVHIGNSVAGAPAAVNTSGASSPTATNTNPAPPQSSGGAVATTPTKAPPAVAGQAPVVSKPPNNLVKPKPASSTPPTTTAEVPAGNAVQTKEGMQRGRAGGATAHGLPAQNGSKTASQTSPAAATSPYAGQAEYQRAESYLNGKGVEQDSAEAAEWFWRSLEAGNTSAAIPLADLYLDGNGVSRSCVQARILLDAAAQKNNPQAIQKLGQLPENCQ